MIIIGGIKMEDLVLVTTRLIWGNDGKAVKKKNVYLDIQGDDVEEYQPYRTNENGDLLSIDSNPRNAIVAAGDYRLYLTKENEPITYNNAPMQPSEFEGLKQYNLKIIGEYVDDGLEERVKKVKYYYERWSQKLEETKRRLNEPAELVYYIPYWKRENAWANEITDEVEKAIINCDYERKFLWRRYLSCFKNKMIFQMEYERLNEELKKRREHQQYSSLVKSQEEPNDPDPDDEPEEEEQGGSGDSGSDREDSGDEGGSGDEDDSDTSSDDEEDDDNEENEDEEGEENEEWEKLKKKAMKHVDEAQAAIDKKVNEQTVNQATIAVGEAQATDQEEETKVKKLWETTKAGVRKLKEDDEKKFRGTPTSKNYATSLKSRGRAESYGEAEDHDPLRGVEGTKKPDDYGPYVVKEGDTLSGLSQGYYGKQGHWDAIYEENYEALGKNPNSIKPGTVIRIPKPRKFKQEE